MPAIPIATLAGELLVRPQPVVCLDACELLGVVEDIAQKRGADQIESLKRLLLAIKKDRVAVVVARLVVEEWRQNLDGVKKRSASS